MFARNSRFPLAAGKKWKACFSSAGMKVDVWDQARNGENHALSRSIQQMCCFLLLSHDAVRAVFCAGL